MHGINKEPHWPALFIHCLIPRVTKTAHFKHRGGDNLNINLIDLIELKLKSSSYPLSFHFPDLSQQSAGITSNNDRYRWKASLVGALALIMDGGKAHGLLKRTSSSLSMSTSMVKEDGTLSQGSLVRNSLTTRAIVLFYPIILVLSVS